MNGNHTNSCTTFQSGNSESQVTGSNIKAGVLDSPVAAQVGWKEAGANAYIMRLIIEGGANAYIMRLITEGL